ncbi:MAG: DUF6242 domain-containing protein [Prevotella sp.]|jgi:hypothetical protein|nr:DUF6242 domain-containing protein [Prevotella sp.]
MKLKQVIRLLFLSIFSVAILSSCNNDDNEYTATGLSADAQIYSFKVSAIPVTSVDSVNYPIMAKAMFSIDQMKALIYNQDSLPYKTALKKFATTLTYSNSSSPSKLQLIYPDSVADWNGSDSIDFSLKPKIKVTAANGTNTREYTIDIRIHKVDPDTLTWKSAGTQPSTIGKQRTILKENTFYTFTIENGSFSLYTADKSNVSVWTKQTMISTLPATVILDNITLFNNTFYAVDAAKKSYSSTDGVTWNARNTNVYSIIGVLPAATEAKDLLLVVTENAGKYYFAKTSDMNTLEVVENLSYNPLSNEVPVNFPVTGFSSVTIYDRSNLNNNLLVTTGGKLFSNAQTNLSWTIREGENKLEIMPTQENFAFTANVGISSFLYDGYMYALTKNVLYKSSSLGYKWVAASAKEPVDSKMPKASGQSIVIDDENYIWVFGGVSDAGSTPVREIWKGRLNKLIP